MSSEDRQDLLAKVGDERRDFLKKIAIAAAFAAPTIATFSIDGMRKKAFAQSAYDAPRVVLDPEPSPGRVLVTFTQPMNTGIGNDSSRIDSSSCRTTVFEGGFPSYEWKWPNNTQQEITFSGCESSTYLNITYNMGSCSPKFVGVNGLELVPYSGRFMVNVPPGPCGS